jgi:hypothetical protein
MSEGVGSHKRHQVRTIQTALTDLFRASRQPALRAALLFGSYAQYRAHADPTVMFRDISATVTRHLPSTPSREQLLEWAVALKKGEVPFDTLPRSR